MSMPDPKVVISDTPPPVVQCRDHVEASACEAVLQVLRRGYVPIMFVVRKEKGGEINVFAQSKDFPSVSYANDVMHMATAKLLHALFRKGLPARTSLGSGVNHQAEGR